MAEEHRGRGCPHHARAVRLVECLQQREPVAAGLRGEHVGVTGVDRGNTRGGQGGETRASILTLLDDHRDITGLDRTAVEGRRAVQQRGDLGGEVSADIGAEVVDRDSLSSPAAELLPRNDPQPERFSAWCAREPTPLVLSLDVVHDDAWITEFGAAQHGL